MQLPSLTDIEHLHQKYAPTPGVFDLVFTHCQIVWAVAEQLLPHSPDLDRNLVKTGCLLHDIGVYSLFDAAGHERTDLHYITHGMRGATILKTEGLPETVQRFASHHTGVGITKHDIESQNLPLPLQNYEAATAEERLIMYADKFHSKSQPPQFNAYNWYKAYIARFGQDKVAKFEQLAQEFGIPDLAPLVKRYRHRVQTQAS